MVAQQGPDNDIRINLEFRFAPRGGALVVSRWYVSEPITVQACDDLRSGPRPAGAKLRRCQTLKVGRIAVRLLPTGRVQLGLLPDASSQAAMVPGDNSRIAAPAETGRR